MSVDERRERFSGLSLRLPGEQAVDHAPQPPNATYRLLGCVGRPIESLRHLRIFVPGGSFVNRLRGLDRGSLGRPGDERDVRVLL